MRKSKDSVDSKISGLSYWKDEGSIYKDGKEYRKCRIRDGIKSKLLDMLSLRRLLDF